MRDPALRGEVFPPATQAKQPLFEKSGCFKNFFYAGWRG
jgi:hypothetical protein